MCGIAGYFGNKPLDKENIESCLGLMKKRGPDNSDFFYQKYNKLNVYLLHSRLSIIDLKEQSNQPFEDEGYIVVFNGEIYNYLELKKKLQNLGHNFKTLSDTEVLLKSYIQYGEKCVDHFNGMWAFVILDKKKGSLFISRDRFGEKPLYFYKNDKEFIFGSEIKFIKNLINQKLEINKKQIFRSLNLGYRAVHQSQETYFNNIYSLKSGSNITIQKNLKLKKKIYWKPKFNPNTEYFYEDIVIQAKKRLEKSLELRLRSDVPIAFCLSGGIDSSYLASLAVKKFKKKIQTFSIIDDDKRYDERNNIKKILKDLNCKNKAIKLKNKNVNFFSRLRRLIEQHDSPIETISYYIHSFLSEEISRSGYKVAISGTGADEIFTGYYQHFLLYFASIKDSNKLKIEIKKWKKHIKPIIRNKELRNPNYYLSNPKNISLTFSIDKDLSKLIKNKQPPKAKEFFFCKDLLRNRMLNELFYEVVPVILNHDDLNSMNYSVENRSPFLDHNLLDFMLTVPTKYLIKDGYQKSILRSAAKNILVEDIRINRKKHGFNASLLSLTNIREIKKFLQKNNTFISEYFDIDLLIKKYLFKKNIKNATFSKFLFNVICIKMFLEIYN